MPARLQWTRLTDEELLKLRMRNLHLRVEGRPLERRIRHLYRELKARGIRFKPHVWLSDEFFTPDGVSGIAIPFYLAHPRLMKLERRQMLELEGGTEKECMRILRHEAGHALDNAYRLHVKPSWRKMFGAVSKPYPQTYKPNPASREYVLHLDCWYAQAHPLEDYAETFAVWLRLGSRWHKRYREWPALQKLEYIDHLMNEIKGKPAINRVRTKVDPLSELKITLGEHYRRKKERYSLEYPDFYDRDLLRIFSRDHRRTWRPTAVSFLRSLRSELCTIVAEGTGVHTYTIDHVLNNIMERAKELKLRMASSEPQTKRETMIMLTVHTMNIVHSGRYRFRYGL